ncbi:sodium/myo-inositol cotransporter 2-like isoform X1 [Haliotis asinina]|uniref:sodium/myo-inositol cotransporter 2-like isoform X1 n=1 Tax=Haliotis asinina TaxID=109174 RepID=UPI003531F035
MVVAVFNWVDILVLVLYFLFVLAVSLMSMCRKNRESVKGYFLAGRTMLWFPIGASLFASNIGSEHFVGLAGSGAASGIAVVAFEWGAVLLLLLLGWVFLPIYLSTGIFTIPEYLQKRFGGNRLRPYLSVLALILYVITKCSVDIYAGAVFIQQAAGWNIYLSIVPLLAVTALYTVVGGLAAVVFTDTLQTIVMLIGAVTLAIMAFVQVGGIDGLYTKYFYAIPETNATRNNTCGMPRADAFHIFRDPVTGDLPWPGIIIRSTVASLWAWCADQILVQRALAAKNMAHAKGATVFAGYLKILPLFLIILPGMVSRILYTSEVACADPATCLEVCGNEAGCSNIAYPKLILTLAPIGLRGLMMAVMLAALMSSLTSVFNSAGTVFTMDLWRKARPAATERELLIVGRAFILVLVAVSLGWIPLIMSSQEGQLFLYIQAVNGYIAPPICALFILAIFVPRINEKGAFWGVAVGQVVGICRLVLDFVYPSPGCGNVDNRPSVVSKVHFTYFSGIVLCVTTIVAVTVSLMTEEPDKIYTDGLTYWSIRKKIRHENAKYRVKEQDNTKKSMTQNDDAKTTTTLDVKLENAAEEGNVIDLIQEKFSLKISEKLNLFLDVNAVVLLCVFAFLYGYYG